MSHKERSTITGIQIEQLIGMAETFERFFYFCGDFMALFKSSLEEMKSIRAAIKKGVQVVSYTEVLRRVPDEHFAKELLERATLVKFELGRLWIQAENSFDMSGLSLVKGLLKSELKLMYGVEHKIRILPPPAS